MPAVDADTTRAPPRVLALAVVVLLAARVITGRYEKEHPSRPRSLVAWVSPERAEALSRERGLPILYEFSADWCTPCQWMDRDVFNDDKVALRINDRYIPVRVIDRTQEEGENPPAVQALFQKYQVISFPHLVLVPPGGGEPKQTRGYPSFSETLAFLALDKP